MTCEQIRALITARMVAFTGVEQARIDYPNQPAVFTPPDDGLWCRLNIQYATAFMAGMADRPYTRKPGQISALEAHFAYWMSGDLECMEASQAIAGEFEGFYQINVNIRFRAG